MVVSRLATRFRSLLASGLTRPRRRGVFPSSCRVVENLEGRQLLSSFAVTHLGPAGAGSLRQAILQANANPGPDVIDFAVSGTVRVGCVGLPAATGPVTIDGNSAPGAAGRPRVTVDFGGTPGFRFAPGSDGSVLRGLSVVRALGAGVTLDASQVTVQGNYIGLAADGTTVLGNRGDGVRINASSHGNVIGDSEPLAGIIDDDAAAFQLSNVIAGNRGNGIGVYGSNDNRIAMNFIGTDATGTQRRGNAGHGIRITAGASRNLIGGEATGGNDPTKGVFVRPPQGNLISGNAGDGVRIDRGASLNQLSGNFVGTTADGGSALGNQGDGVAILGADDNRLIGCRFDQDPFVFYNVISGNRGNGLRIHDANGTTVQANFLGTGADNATVVGNHGDGLLVSGRSRDTLVGGLIPLGNVISGNDRHGIEVIDQVSRFTSYNTFGGAFAFGGAAPNGGDGIRITATGADILLPVNLFSGNRGDGVSIGGRASGVRLMESVIGLDITAQVPIPNRGNGICIWGQARGTIIGGPPPADLPGGLPVDTTLPVMVATNLGHGLLVTGRARDTIVIGTLVGTNPRGLTTLGNGRGGIVLDPCTSGTTIGGTAEAAGVKIAFNRGDGLGLRSSRRNTIAGVEIVDNGGVGLIALGDCEGTLVRDSSITGNRGGDVDLRRARGIVYIPGA